MGVLDRVKEAFSRFPSGVVIATARDLDGTPRGFTASSFSSLSLDPPLVLICLHRNAECHRCFENCGQFAVSILRPHHEPLARLLATRGADKFSGDGFVSGAHGLPIVRDALATLICRTEARFPGGDHTIITAAVEQAEAAAAADAMVHYARSFWSVGAAERATA